VVARDCFENFSRLSAGYKRSLNEGKIKWMI
jgi:hypothetical protein